MKVPVVLEYQFGIILTAKGFMNSKRGICLAEEYFVETARQAGMDMDEKTPPWLRHINLTCLASLEHKVESQANIRPAGLGD